METWLIMGQLHANVSKTRAGKTYTYRMLSNFRTLVTYKNILRHARQLCPL